MKVMTPGATLPTAPRCRQAALISASLSANTRRAYKHAWNSWLDWLGDLPASDATLSAYLAALHEAGKAPATCALHAAALRFAHRMGIQAAPAPGPLTDRTLAGIRREGCARGRGKVKGITWAQADAAVQVAAQTGLSGLRDAALVATMSDALLRASEASALTVADIQHKADGSGRLTIMRSKTDQEGKGSTLYLGPPTMQRLGTYLQAAYISEGPLFRRIRRGNRVTRSALSPVSVRQIVRSRAAGAGLHGRYSAHSLRVGGAQSLIERGATLPEAQLAGRWQSPSMVAHYAAGQLAGRGAVARLRYATQAGDQIPHDQTT